MYVVLYTFPKSPVVLAKSALGVESLPLPHVIQSILRGMKGFPLHGQWQSCIYGAWQRSIIYIYIYRWLSHENPTKIGLSSTNQAGNPVQKDLLPTPKERGNWLCKEVELPFPHPRLELMNGTLWLCQNSYWTWPSRKFESCPIKNGGSFQFVMWKFSRG